MHSIIDQHPKTLEPGANDRGMKELAFAVFRQAITDAGIPVERRGGCKAFATKKDSETATQFLFADGEWIQARARWLAWLGLDETAWVSLRERPSLLGGENRLLGIAR